MTMPEQIMRAVSVLVRDQGLHVFSRKQIRIQAGLDIAQWNLTGSPTFQGMRVDEPGGAPNVGKRYQNVFRRVAYARYVLTDYGEQLLREL